MANGMSAIQQEVARRQSSPFTGKLSARPAGKPGIFACQREFATIPSPPLASCSYQNTEAPQYAFSKAWRNLSGPMGFPKQNQPLGRDRAASRRSAPNPGKRTRREDRAPSHRPQMSSGRLFLDRVARQHCPSPLHRHEEHNMRSREVPGDGDISTLPGRGHFYFALTDAARRLTARIARDILTPHRGSDQSSTSIRGPHVFGVHS